MKKVILIVTSIVLSTTLLSLTMSDNGKAGATGSPGEVTCHNCHNDFLTNSGQGSISINSSIFPNGEYIPGNTYNVEIYVQKNGMPLFGVGVECLTATATGPNAGTLTITNPATTQIKTSTTTIGVSRTNVVHQFNGGNSSGGMFFRFNWTAPPAGTGPVTFYFAGIAANNDGNESGDYVYVDSYNLQENISTGINETQVNNKNIYLKSIDMTGREVDSSFNGFRIDCYTNGSIKKIFKQ